MLKLRENEKEVLILRKHWFVMIRIGALAAFLLLLLPFLVTLFAYAAEAAGWPELEILADFFAMIFLMGIALFVFFAWTDYYLDLWIVTNQRLIDVEQNGLFNRDVAEVPLERVQDITVEVHGFFETMLHFGTIRLQTAGEREFRIEDVPHLEKAKDVILQYSRQAGATTGTTKAQNTDTPRTQP